LLPPYEWIFCCGKGISVCQVDSFCIIEQMTRSPLFLAEGMPIAVKLPLHPLVTDWVCPLGITALRSAREGVSALWHALDPGPADAVNRFPGNPADYIVVISELAAGRLSRP